MDATQFFGAGGSAFTTFCRGRFPEITGTPPRPRIGILRWVFGTSQERWRFGTSLDA